MTSAPACPPQSASHDRLSSNLRLIALVCGLASTAFWVYTFYYIANLPRGDGSGFQWLGEMPLSMIWLFLSLPAIGLSLSNGSPRCSAS